MRQKTIEEYVEAIYALEERGGRAQTGMIAQEIDVKPPSVTEMLQKLEREGLVRYESYTGATLTPSGRAMARDLMGRHRVLAEFLGLLGVDPETAETDACQVEHHVSAETVERLERFVVFVRSAPEGRACMERFGRHRERGR